MGFKPAYGWRPDPRDVRDRRVKDLLKGVATFGDQADWETHCPPVKDQDWSGSCVGQSGAGAFDTAASMNGHKWFSSALFNYFIARYLTGDHYKDIGSGLRYLFKAVQFYGVCPEVEWPFDLWAKNPNGSPKYPSWADFLKERVNHDPSWNAYRKARDQKWLKGYYRIDSIGDQRIMDMKQALYEKGIICFGMDVGQPFEDYSGGILDDAGPRKGGHAMFLYGYYRNEFWKGQNSWGCYDDRTEILTNVGWKRFYSLDGSEQVATLNPDTKCLEYQDVEKYHTYDYDGDLLSFQGRGVDLVVTPNHRMYVGTRKGTWKILRAEEIDGQDLRFQKTANNLAQDLCTIRVAEEAIPADLWLEFFGYWLSEGNTRLVEALRTRTRDRAYAVTGEGSRCGTTGRFVSNPNPVPEKRVGSVQETYVEKYYLTSLCQKNGEKASKIQSCLDKLHIKFSRRERSGMVIWSCTRKALFEELSRYGKASDKYIPRKFLQLSSRQSRILLDAMMLGDGSYRGSDGYYYTASRQMADDVQELALRCGLAADVSCIDRTDRPGYNHPEYTVCIRTAGTQPMAKRTPGIHAYKGKVYCVTVPNGIVYVRRNGRAVWSGNSDWGEKGRFRFTQRVANAMRDIWVIQFTPAYSGT